MSLSDNINKNDIKELQKSKLSYYFLKSISIKVVKIISWQLYVSNNGNYASIKQMQYFCRKFYIGNKPPLDF